MKLIHFTFFILGILNLAGARSASDSLVTTEIHYSCPEATRVFLVWGINGWQTQEKDLIPAGTYIVDNLLYTPMKLKDGIFSIQLKVKRETTIDYVFWISGGLRNTNTDVWDVNSGTKKDYHTLAQKDSAVFIESTLPARPKEALSLLDFAWQIWAAIVLCALLLFIIKKYRYNHISLNPGPEKIILASAGILVLALFFIRSSVTMMSWDLYVNPLGFILQVFWSGFYDFLYVTALTIVFIFFLVLFRRFSRLRSFVAYSFIAISIFSLVVGILNIRIVEMLGKPFNYRWLYYSDFLNSTEAKSAFLSNMTFDYAVKTTVVCIAAALAGILLIYISEFLARKYRMRKVFLTGLICLPLGYTLFAHRAVNAYKWNYDRLANPVVAFMGSLPLFTQTSELFTMDVPDSLKISGQKSTYNLPHPYPEAQEKIRNVIVLVLESTPAEYIQPYDQTFRLTPELEKHLSQSIIFDNVYAHAPATNKSLVTLLGSVYPWLSHTSITQEHPAIEIPTLSSELKRHGYRTAFFNSGDNRFQKTGKFLAHRKFDMVRDCKSMHCGRWFHPPRDEEGNPLDGIDDECTAKELMNWLNKDLTSPFFAMMWTYQTHYPYYVLTPEKKYNTSDPVFNRYLNAVHHSDVVLGKLLEELKKNDLFESTLVVVIGDHGEAFGRHDQTTHASKIYEENVHVPCIFINPIFKGKRITTAGGLVDIAPTIMNMLGLAEANKWQGRDLLTAGQDKRVYFFAPWSDYYFGYREGNRKYIFNATKNTTEIYDLKADPYETINLAPEFPGQVEHAHQCLAAWAQYSNRFMGNLINPNPNGQSGK